MTGTNITWARTRCRHFEQLDEQSLIPGQWLYKISICPGDTTKQKIRAQADCNHLAIRWPIVIIDENFYKQGD